MRTHLFSGLVDNTNKGKEATMDVILIKDNDINEVIAVYTIEKFIHEANKEYWEANNYCGARYYFNPDTLEFAINWYIETSDNLSIDVMKLEDSEA